MSGSWEKDVYYNLLSFDIYLDLEDCFFFVITGFYIAFYDFTFSLTIY